MPKKLLNILIAVALISACSSWNNFRAYYNTFYNAKKSFRSGLKKVDEQAMIIDPAQPVLVHQAPPEAGSEDFEEAIENGIQVLRDYRQSKWVDDALFLIGKSYYYLHKYYAALQKFEELHNSSSLKMKHYAVIWKGKTLLALGRFTDGSVYLEGELGSTFDQNSMQRKAEIQILTGEHHAMLQNWDRAAQWLSKAINNIENDKLLGRTLFLYGQVLERSQRYGEAYYTFSRIPGLFPGFEYTYWAIFKRADVARKQGNMDLAISIYEDLRRDDKNMERREELIFQIARTLEMKGDAAEAVQIYQNLINSEQGIQRSLQADIYYRLGKINSDVFKNYPVAGAYFDSSSALSNAENIDATALAEAYGRFTSLHKMIQRADSLLWLSSLSPSKLDAVIERIMIKKRRQLLEQQDTELKNRVLNLNAGVSRNSQTTSIYGFLNYRNEQLVNRGKAAFGIIWGNRPLVDNWRRMEAVRQTAISSGPMPEIRMNTAVSNEETTAILDLNTDEIPKTPKERAELQSEKVVAQYKLGSLLFLKLNAPDSARLYFHRVMHSSAGKELRSKAMYSLYQLFNAQNKSDSLTFWKREILESYPTSKYALRLQSKGEERVITQAYDRSSPSLREKYHQVIASKAPHKASRLRTLALVNRFSGQAPAIFYQAIQEYIRQAKKLTKMNNFVATATLPDPSGKAQAIYLVPQKLEHLHFANAYWDSVRMAIDEFISIFVNAHQYERVVKLKKIVELPASSPVPTCKSLGVKLKVESGMSGFLSKVEYPQKLENTSLSGSISYSFIVNAEGEIESYQLASKRTSLGIEGAFEAAFDQLQFQPLIVKNPPAKIRCEVEFPIQK